MQMSPAEYIEILNVKFNILLTVYHNNLTNSIHFHFHNHFIVS
jgi:hypothetical protein